MKSLKSVFIFVLVVCSLSSCHEGFVNPNRELTLDAYSSYSSHTYTLSLRRIHQQMDQLIREDSDSMSADYRVRSYYSLRKNLLWIDRHGIDHRADTLVACIDTLSSIGLSTKKFRVEQIKADLRRIRELDFDAENPINKVMARLEYNLSKAYLRYVVGQRFGFVNPTYLFNHIDTLQQNSTDEGKWTTTHYRQLFDLEMEHANNSFYKKALDKIAHDSVGVFLRDVEPISPMYKDMLSYLKNKHLSGSMKKKVLCNMERCRWRLNDYPQKYKKYVVVNIPSLRLNAVDGDQVLSMRVGCGTTKTKTPLLYSRIRRMDINPRWTMPRSIVEKDVMRHVGEISWFENNHYLVRNKETNERIPLGRVTRSMLHDPNYIVMQEGGEGNSLGRIIFRFDNDFSVFLHSTSSPGVFSRSDREVSHGCVRVEKPFDLAKFMLEEKDDNIIQKISYSMAADVSSIHSKKEGDTDDDLKSNQTDEDGNTEKEDTLDRSKLITTLKVIPEVPVFILYFTLYPYEHSGKYMEYPDVYGYDSIILNHLQNYR